MLNSKNLGSKAGAFLAMTLVVVSLAKAGSFGGGQQQDQDKNKGSVGSCAQSVVAPWLAETSPLMGAQFTTAPDDTHSPELALINSATKSLYMEMYHLSDASLLTGLENLAKAGVDVQVIIDQGALKSTNYGNDAAALTAAGVKVYKSSTAFTLTHTKTFVVDNREIFISTMNLVGFYQEMRDYGVFLTDPTIIADFNTMFQADIANSQNNTNVTPTLLSPNLILAPTNARQKIVDMINAAAVSVQLTVENLQDPQVVAALVSAAQRCGIQVTVMVPECTLTSTPTYNFPALNTLATAGVQVHVMGPNMTPTTPYMHAKTIVIDNRWAYIGSENFSTSSLTTDRELGVVIGDPQVIADLNKVFQTDWGNAVPLPSTIPTCPAMN